MHARQIYHPQGCAEESGCVHVKSVLVVELDTARRWIVPAPDPPQLLQSSITWAYQVQMAGSLPCTQYRRSIDLSSTTFRHVGSQVPSHATATSFPHAEL